MRRIFADILKNKKINFEKEYERLYDLFFNHIDGRSSVRDIVEVRFQTLPFKRTCTSLDDFDDEFGFVFEEEPERFDLDYLINFCEYIYNLVFYISDGLTQIKCIKEQVVKVVESIEYTFIYRDDGLNILVSKSPQAMLVAETVSEHLSYKILEYNHHSLKGDLEGKKSILIKIAQELEPQRDDLKSLDSQLEKNLFKAFNNFNIRHNNCDEKNKKKFNAAFTALDNERREVLYDWTYNQCLIAFIKLENKNANTLFEEMKNNMKE